MQERHALPREDNPGAHECLDHVLQLHQADSRGTSQILAADVLAQDRQRSSDLPRALAKQLQTSPHGRTYRNRADPAHPPYLLCVRSDTLGLQRSEQLRDQQRIATRRLVTRRAEHRIYRLSQPL